MKPTVFVGVPRVWEKIAEKMKAVAATVHGPMKTISTWAKAKNLEHAKNRQLGGNGEYPKNFGPAEFVMGKVRGKLGLDQCQMAISGAAPITKETLEYFGQLGINILETYGMSESSGPTTINTTYCSKWGSIGYAPPGFEVAIFDTMSKPGQLVGLFGKCWVLPHEVRLGLFMRLNCHRRSINSVSRP